MSAPATSSRRIWAIVASTSAVGVLVIDCTVIGAPPPTGTEPTWICRLWRAMDLAIGANGRHGGVPRAVLGAPAI